LLTQANYFVEQYLLAFKESLQGYKPMRLLLEGFFSLCFNNPAFHDEFLIYIAQK
jgi:hypothetical protein